MPNRVSGRKAGATELHAFPLAVRQGEIDTRDLTSYNVVDGSTT
ncbi:MAG TPA: hypothetical protein VG722_13370 [Tepidisphaeraceae bacterium]|nr:hypothetical protein [Tepidisphaeraceae bacterium]